MYMIIIFVLLVLRTHLACLSQPSLETNNSTNSTNPCDVCDCINGVCWPTKSSSNQTLCYCQNGYTGYQCHIDYNDCELTRCRNGATCVDKVAQVECICPPGFEGNTNKY